MKRKVTTSIYAPLRWLSLVVVMLVSALSEVQANTGDYYYYNAKATANPTSAGKVYISSEATQNPPFQSSTSTTGKQSQYGVGGSLVTLYMYAQENNENWIFQNWTYNGEVVSTSTSYNTTLPFDGDNSNPTLFNFTANFLAQTGLIRVRSDNVNLGTVSINPRENIEGNTVTLNAIPDASNGVLFLGWKKDNESEYCSRNNPYILTANNETKGVYTAFFSDPAEKVFVRLQNKATGRFISFYGNQIVGPHIRSYDGNTVQDGFVFTNSLKMLSASEAQGNPETVFLQSGHPAGTGVTTDADLAANRTQYSNLLDDNHHTNQYMLSIVKSGDSYHIYTVFKFDDNGTEFNVNSFLCDEGGDWLVMKSMDQIDESAEWYIYALDENSTVGAFGANAKEKYTREGKYYTTMYTDFPYQCKDGVKAYYLTKDDNENVETEHVVHFTEIANGMVPANMAVVLECPTPQNDISSTNVVCNRLIPLFTDVPQIINPGLHPLKGYVSVNGSTVSNDYSTMYVLSYDDPSKENHLGFYHYSKSAMTPNKAYLEIPKVVAENNNVTVTSFVFGKDSQEETDKITVYNLFVADEDAPVYDLLGRKVEGILPKGIYIRNGKKFIVK